MKMEEKKIICQTAANYLGDTGRIARINDSRKDTSSECHGYYIKYQDRHDSMVIITIGQFPFPSAMCRLSFSSI